MRQARQRDRMATALESPKIRSQPSYHAEVSEADLEATQKAVNARKPENFNLTAISDAGW